MEIIFTVHPDLSATADITYLFYGQSAEEMRRFFTENDQIRQQQFFQKLTADFSRVAEVKTPWKTQDDKNSFKLHVVFSLKGYISQTGNIAVVPIPFINSWTANIPSISDRKTPVWIGSENSNQLSIKIKLPQNYKPTGQIPVNINRSINNIYGYAYSRTLHDNTISINAVSVNDIGYIDPENASAIAQHKKMTASPDLKFIFLERTVPNKK